MPHKGMPASSKFSIQVQTAFEGVMGGIANERANSVCTGDQFSPQGPPISHSWQQERQSCASIPESCSLDRNLGRKHASLSALRAECEASWFMCPDAAHTAPALGRCPDHKKAASSPPAPPRKRRFLLNRFSRNLKRLSGHLNRKYPILNRITATYFKSRSIAGKSGRCAHKSNQGTGNLEHCMFPLSLGHAVMDRKDGYSLLRNGFDRMRRQP